MLKLFSETKLETIFLIFILSLAGVSVKTFRKKFVKNTSMNTTIIIDVIFTSFFVLLYISLFGNTNNILSELKNMSPHYWIYNIIISLLLASGILLGRFLLLRNNISYLEGMHISFDVLLSIFLGFFLLSEKITIEKIIGSLLILLGVASLNV